MLTKRENRVTLHVSEKINFKLKIFMRDKEGNYIMIKRSIHHEDKFIHLTLEHLNT